MKPYSGYKNELKYLESNRNHKKWGNNIGNNRTNNDINMDNKKSMNNNKNRRRNIILFNPLFLQTL